MGKDYITIGSTPAGETCAQLGKDDYYPRMRKETKAFIHQLRRRFGEEPYGARIAVKGFEHDFGTYHEVVVYYNDDNEESYKYAMNIENNCPEWWDDEAKKELAVQDTPFTE